MISKKLVGLNTKWYRYKNNITQETLSNKTGFKDAYISKIERFEANLTCNSIDILATSLNIKPNDLFNEETALKAQKLPNRVDKYNSK